MNPLSSMSWWRLNDEEALAKGMKNAIGGRDTCILQRER